jgi:ABC-type Mn2+/Zn2+ transport system ATPase subunit
VSAALAFSDVTVCRGRHPVVHHLSCEFPSGAFVGILGANGAGKTSLLQAMLGWLPLSSGGIEIGGRPARESLKRVSYLAQRHGVDVDYPITVEELVAMGRYQRLGFARRFGDEDRRVVESAIAELGLEPLRARQIARLSGGQLQRAFLARALATGADIFLLDEPLAGLDPTACHDLLARLRRWRGHERLVVAVLHDLAAAKACCSHLILLRSHLVAAGETAAVLTERNLVETFGPSAARLAAVESSAGVDGRVVSP